MMAYSRANKCVHALSPDLVLKALVAAAFGFQTVPQEIWRCLRTKVACIEGNNEHWTMRNVHCSVNNVHCPEHTVHCSVNNTIDQCIMYNWSVNSIYCPVNNVNCPMRNVYWPVSNVHCIISNCPMNNVPWPVRSVHCSVNNVHWPLRNVYCPVNNVHWLLCNIHWTVNNIFSYQSPFSIFLWSKCVAGLRTLLTSMLEWEMTLGKARSLTHLFLERAESELLEMKRTHQTDMIYTSLEVLTSLQLIVSLDFCVCESFRIGLAA